MPIETPNKVQEVPVLVIKNILILAISGFGVVVALAWNDAIQAFFKTYVVPYFGPNSGIVSLFLYAIIVTILAVIVTMQLAYLQKRIEKYQGIDEEKENE